MALARRHSFATPGIFPDWLTFFVALLFLLVTLIADEVTGDKVRLHVLYVFPLSAIAFHCKRMWLSYFAFAFSIVLQLLTFYRYGVSRSSLITDLVVAAAASILIIFISRSARINYLRVLELAETDALTQLANRGAFISMIEIEITRQRRYGGLFSLVGLDLDGFKKLNDTRGHAFGDEALILLANILQHSTRDSDLVARLGGDEFIVLMPSTQHENCISFCENLCRTIKARMEQAGFAITASIGFKTFSEPPESTLAALQQVDELMYRAKINGRGQVAYSSESK